MYFSCPLPYRRPLPSLRCADHCHRRCADHCYCRHRADHSCCCRHSVAPSIAVAIASPSRRSLPSTLRCHCVAVTPSIAVAVALPSHCPCPSPPLLGGHCNHRADHRCRHRRSVAPSIAVAIVAVASLLHLQSPLPSHHRRAFHCCRHCPLVDCCLATGGHYNGVVCSLRQWQ